MDRWTVAQIANAQVIQEEAEKDRIAARNQALARLAMEAEAAKVKEAMADAARAERSRIAAQNREQGFRDNWRR